MDFKYNNAKLIKDETIQSIIQTYWSDATEEDIESLLYKLCNVGCGYTAMVNTVFNEYAGKEEEFEQTFGYKMYTINNSGKIDYNYEYLILDYFCYIWCGEYDEISDVYGTVDENVTDGSVSNSTSDEEGATGTNKKRKKYFSDFLEKNFGVVDCTIECTEQFEDKDRLIALYEEYANDYDYVIISARGYDLYTMDGELYRESGGAHAMYITGVIEDPENDDFNFIVSSWGEEFILDVDSLINGKENEDGTITYGYFTGINYE